MTLKEWSARPDLVENLSQLLRMEPLNEALSVVESIGAPRARLRPDSPNLMENHALLNARREGYFEAIANLRALAVPREKDRSQDLAPWKHASEQDN